ncbi:MULTISPECIES: protein translocase subunit SecD [unclassified Shewanella]|uniref:protein translocase subunit SecD n=1 Tax=unclassified Shewanella TaxID=196818 RepID=UPI000C848BF2|nr:MULTISPECIES: protein translocase subunit SecD [unclassified Shewanella]MDO6619531.1 protein translocase subunit SecD [Shewanella sp. 6_MG-2023]MDO6641239.1 protein translocase subunit SecD [Shewanella sp. 5_MG-2023]MDO6679447.1 protein translocase subunit SecD [Shewanella sp. 4_MG-2023]MDO6775826.1 protein translocase subunit SecD [Shewanella sp. 3_MG-2023]PMG29819.1 protein-export membrane protein SecD [Shewanella sp. 10N.286.52.C2]
MLNKYPMWKNIMVMLVIAIGAFYATPNLFGEDHAVQVVATRGAEVTTSTLSTVNGLLESKGIAVKRSELEDGQLLVRVQNSEQQLLAKEAIADSLGDKYTVALNLAPATPEWLEALGGSPMKFGLDLRGGVHFLMEVDMGEAIRKMEEAKIADFRSQLREEKIRYAGVRKTAKGLEIKFRDAENLAKAERFLKSRNNNEMVFNDGSSGENFALYATMSDSYLSQIKEEALQQNMTTIRNRVNELGVAEPVVQRQGAERIIVELPGVQDTARAKEILGATASIEFRMVDQNTDQSAAANGRVPATSEVFPRRSGGIAVLKKEVMLTGDHITGAQPSFDEYSRPQVSINLDAKGGNIFSNVTKDNIGNPMATLFIEYKDSGIRNPDGSVKMTKIEEVISVATIQARLGRNFVINGLDHSEAQSLALLLRAGALIAPVTIVEERTIGPSLGAQNVENGIQAMIWGLAVVLVFMLIYYRAFGVIANLALTANLVMVVGVMSMIPGAVLTLPGIAGMVLTVGMAVDGNVLIYERIREELLAGRSVQQAIHEGYANAFSTIADANITTFMTALILFAVGTGAVKGFAITLMIGIATSMFTSIVGTRVIVNLMWGGKRVKKLSI